MKKYILLITITLAALLTGCSGFLDQDPNKILSYDQVFNDPKLIKSALANMYGRITWGQHAGGDVNHYSFLDEAVRHDRDDIGSFDRNWWRVYDYTLIRNTNEFMEGIKGATKLTEDEKNALIAEARFIRAWCYFCTARSLGGMPIVGDEVLEYISGTDVTTLQFPRATEAEIYDYIIKECSEIAAPGMLSASTNKYSARANKWTAKMLEARAALYAGSLAKYNVNHPNLTVEGGAVGIDAGKAADYYQKALAAAKEVIENSPYELQTNTDKGRNFYEAVSVKTNNTEVIWSRDYQVPISKHYFTKDCIPRSIAGEATSCRLSILLNLVEEFEPIDAETPGQGAKFNFGTIEEPVFYNTASEPFETRDARLAGTVLYPGSYFNGAEIVLQAGQLVKNEAGNWEATRSSYRDMGNSVNGKLLTSINGPIMTNDINVNKTGFNILKFLDEKPASSTFTGSDTWSTYFRIAEAYLIAAEALVETNKAEDALPYINKVRERAGVKALTTVTFENIVHERRVEFAFEDHRFWDMKRWRLADKVWNREKETAKRRGLFPYLVVAPGDPNDGKWFFEEVSMDFLYRNNLHFEDRHYYADIDQGWVNNNPKMKKNPYQ
ncbi:RagB/SusD family nutrient uptake outer membrane protein [Bacteroides sp. 519]|uniref:RagB/SusD family nutrient uptake outer membrane protein n=1 Tax=Bacteroides sp. 519 TaxID=2302937 RepID=UPI0013D4864C|nr:RagB/SusD family nutrient uptake outer membrane protein [Bacteroides sp. 519]NDV58148.1 RagB/SusD family nutrient uptake outer membrane protein [Bacteroides sp. 519]